MQTTPETVAHVKEVISIWYDPIALAAAALQRQGRVDSDGGFGIVYPENLDEYQREVEGEHIPEGHVLVFGFWGPEHGGYEVLVAEKLYLALFAEHLQALGFINEAAGLRTAAQSMG